jgi:hypothetical protein
MDAAGAVHGHENQLGFAMTMPAAPLTRRDMMQPEQAQRPERQVLPRLDEIQPAALVDSATHIDPTTVPDFQTG